VNWGIWAAVGYWAFVCSLFLCILFFCFLLICRHRYRSRVAKAKAEMRAFTRSGQDNEEWVNSLLEDLKRYEDQP
jgi:hypothetical protein